MSGDPERDERLRRLFQAKHEGDTDFLIAALSHYGGDEIGLPATWLAEAGEKRAIPQLVRLLDASSPDARRSAAKALEELGPPESARRRLIELAREDQDAPARSWAIGALGKYRDPSLIPMIVAFLEDDDWRVRNGAAAALGDIGHLSAIEPLRQAKRRLWRSPLGWYLNNAVYREAITSLRSGSSSRPKATLLPRLSGWLRRWLWRGAAILAFILLFGWIFGGWSAGVNIVQWLAIVLSGLFLVFLLSEGWVEWRERRRNGGTIRPPDAD